LIAARAWTIDLHEKYAPQNPASQLGSARASATGTVVIHAALVAGMHSVVAASTILPEGGRDNSPGEAQRTPGAGMKSKQSRPGGELRISSWHLIHVRAAAALRGRMRHDKGHVIVFEFSSTLGWRKREWRKN
jgi:hypothetical protein